MQPCFEAYSGFLHSCYSPPKNTDAAAGQLVAGGIVVGALSVPTRYIHAPVGMVKKSDIAQTVALATAFLENAARFGI